MKDADIIVEALERFKLADEANSDNRDEMLDDFKFLNLQQWDENLKRSRENDPDGARPCLVFDKVNQYVNQVINDMRQSRPAPKFRPVDDNADEEVAEVLQGVGRNILDKSSADIAIDTAFEHAVKAGAGYFRLITDYQDDLSFDQDIEIKRILNPFSVYLDPNSTSPDGSDAKWAFITEELTKEDFELQFHDAEAVDWESGSDNGWIQSDKIRIAEYFYKEEKNVTIVQLSNGWVLPKAEVEKNAESLTAMGIGILGERESTETSIKWCKLSSKAVLEKTDWAGKYIPVIPVYGDEVEIEGKICRSGLTRKAKDAQKAYNYASSAFIERVALVPKSPYIAAAGQIENYQAIWEDANTKNISVLPYDPVSIDGSPVAPPQRQMATDIPQGWLGVMQATEHDIQASLGIYNSSLGEQSNEISGKAILARNAQGDNATLHYVDNLGRSIRHLGRILIDLIPKIYDTKRVLRIIGEDDQVQNVTFDPSQPQPVMSQMDAEGKEVSKIYNPSIGKYDVVTTVGTSYATKRMEAAEALNQMMQYYPQLMQIGGDIMVKNMDWNGAEELAKRLERTIPENLKSDDEQQALPPEVQQALQGASDTINNLTAQLADSQQQLDDKQADQNNDNAETKIKAYEAETKRMKEVQGNMSPEQIQAMILETIQGLSTTPDISNEVAFIPEGTDFM